MLFAEGHQSIHAQLNVAVTNYLLACCREICYHSVLLR